MAIFLSQGKSAKIKKKIHILAKKISIFIFKFFKYSWVNLKIYF